MPPHCDTMDGPVVVAARSALEKDNVNLILPWVHEAEVNELRDAFARARNVRVSGNIEARELAESWFFETAVRLHRSGEMAPYTGLKPAGLDEGPVLPLAKEALKTGDARQLLDLLQMSISCAINGRLEEAGSKSDFEIDEVAKAREYVHASLEFMLYAHHLWEYIEGREHGL